MSAVVLTLVNMFRKAEMLNAKNNIDFHCFRYQFNISFWDQWLLLLNIFISRYSVCIWHVSELIISDYYKIVFCTWHEVLKIPVDRKNYVIHKSSAWYDWNNLVLGLCCVIGWLSLAITVVYLIFLLVTFTNIKFLKEVACSIFLEKILGHIIPL